MPFKQKKTANWSQPTKFYVSRYLPYSHDYWTWFSTCYWPSESVVKAGWLTEFDWLFIYSYPRSALGSNAWEAKVKHPLLWSYFVPTTEAGTLHISSQGMKEVIPLLLVPSQLKAFFILQAFKVFPLMLRPHHWKHNTKFNFLVLNPMPGVSQGGGFESIIF